MVNEAKEAWLLRKKCGGVTLFQRENILTLVQHAGSGTLDAPTRAKLTACNIKQACRANRMSVALVYASRAAKT
jgi:hypothetical protein